MKRNIEVRLYAAQAEDHILLLPLPLVISPEAGDQSRDLKVGNAMTSRVEVLSDWETVHVEPNGPYVLGCSIGHPSLGLTHVDFGAPFAANVVDNARRRACDVVANPP